MCAARALSNQSLLIVDDDRDVADALRDALEDEGFTVAVAQDGLEALERLRSGLRPALILLDWMMPRCDGETFRYRQLESPELASIPVIFVTADQRDRARRLTLGTDVVELSKPINLDELLKLVERHCKRGRTGDRGSGPFD